MQIAFCEAAAVLGREYTEEYQIACACTVRGKIIRADLVTVCFVIGQGGPLPRADACDHVDHAVRLVCGPFRYGLACVDVVDAHITAVFSHHRNDADAVQTADVGGLFALLLRFGEGKPNLVPTALLYIVKQRPPQFLLIHGSGTADLHHAAGQVGNVVNIDP